MTKETNTNPSEKTSERFSKRTVKLFTKKEANCKLGWSWISSSSWDAGLSAPRPLDWMWNCEGKMQQHPWVLEFTVCPYPQVCLSRALGTHVCPQPIQASKNLTWKEETGSQGLSSPCNPGTLLSKTQRGEKKKQNNNNKKTGLKYQGSTSIQLLLTQSWAAKHGAETPNETLAGGSHQQPW